MGQVFPRSANVFVRFALAGGAIGAVVFLAASYTVFRSPWVNDVGYAREQPVPFSHAHHTGALGIDCRFCHTSADEAAFAGIPPTETCMACHRQVWNESPMLAPVRESWRTGRAIRWVRVHNLPDYVYFDHSVHVAKGIGCASCHGRVDRMPLMKKAAPLSMSWCLDCHRDPAPHLRPPAQIYAMGWTPPADEAEARALGTALMERNDVRRRTSCSTCHR